MIDVSSGGLEILAQPRHLSEQLLRNVPMFARLDDSAVTTLVQRLESQFTPGGELVFDEGEPGDSLYIIERGEIEIRLRDDEGHGTTLAQLGPGEFFGELSLLDGKTRSAAAMAATDAQLLKLTRPTFLQILRQQEVLESVLCILSERIRRADTMVSVTGVDNRKLREEARTDALTKLGNRRRMREDLDTLNARAKRYGQTYSLAMCDIDFFKRYNDSCGHPAGDEVIRRVAATLAGECRSGDAVYRYGGEEFVVVMPQQTIGGAATGMERIRAAVEAMAIQHPDYPGGAVVTISCGVAAVTLKGKTVPTAPINEADEALYEAKDGGRNRVCVWKAPVRQGAA
jgi:diguanylate cyclase (GGDEF)-like protein